MTAAEHISPIDLPAYQEAVRLLLVHPLVTETTPHAGALGTVRRWEDTLRSDFDRLARWRLTVTPGCARLVKRPLTLDAGHGLSSRTGRPFDRRRYAYVCLVLSLLLRSGAQVLVTELAEQLRHRAEEIAGLGFDPDVHSHRQAFVDAVRWIESCEALRICEGTTDAYLRNGEALYDVGHDAVHELFAPPAILQHLTSIDDVFVEQYAENREGRRLRDRHRITRMLLERPAVYTADLSDTEVEYLRREGRTIIDDVERLTGASVERRREGLTLVDTHGTMSDRRFPAGGTPSHAALLLGERLLEATTTIAFPPTARTHRELRDRIDRSAGLTPESNPAADHEHAAVAMMMPWSDVDAACTSLVSEYANALRKDVAGEPQRFRDLALGDLTAFDLVRVVPDGVAVMPALARYRPEVKVDIREGTQLSLIGSRNSEERGGAA